MQRLSLLGLVALVACAEALAPRTLPDTINRISRSTLTDSGGRFGLFALGATEGSRWVHVFVHDTASGRITRPAPARSGLMTRHAEGMPDLAERA